MNFNYRGEYVSTTRYFPRDVVAHKNNSLTKYYFCLVETTGVSPTPNVDTNTWSLINTLSNFPNSVDTFITRKNILASDKPLIERYQRLSLLTSPTIPEQNELSELRVALADKLLTSDDFNQLQQSISNLQMFFKTNVEGYINQLKDEFNVTIDTSKKQVITVMNESVSTMESKKNTFETFVGTKEDGIRGLVQDFDSRSTRYYQNWTAKNKQVIYNIFLGNVSNVPTEARLMLDEKDIDVIIQGVLLRPYVDYRIAPNNNYDSIELLIDANLITAGTEVIAKWYKNVGKLYFKHSSTHEYGGTDQVMNLREEQLYPELKDKINSGGIKLSVQKPKNGIWFEII